MKKFLLVSILTAACFSAKTFAGNSTNSSTSTVAASQLNIKAKAIPANILGQVHVYPNPYKPNSNTAYNDTSLGQGIVFTGLPSTTQIKIFTISGELVKEMQVSSVNGTFLWDTYNKEGLKCASGIYIFMVTSRDVPGAKSTGKFAIVR